MRKAANFNYKRARRKILIDGKIKYERINSEFIIINQKGKIVTYGKNSTY